MTGPLLICNDCKGDGVVGDWPMDCPSCNATGRLPGEEEVIKDFVAKLDAWGTEEQS